MDTDLLRSWLGLPPGPWPPPERELNALLGDPGQAERRAMQLMSRLRPHQLLHPDLVTEGMNRLAQAMLAGASQRPSVPSAVPPPPPPVPPGGQPVTVVVPTPAGPPTPEPIDLAPDPPAQAAPPRPEPVVLDAEVVEDGPAEAAIPFARFEQSDEPAPARPAPAAAEFAPLPEVEPPRLSLPPGLSADSRRRLYRDLAALRALMRAWDALRTFCGNPSEAIDTPGRVYALGEAVTLFHAAVRHLGFDAGALVPLAPRVFAVFRQPSPLAVLRLLTLPQRRHLARDWAAGQSHLAARSVALRNSLRRTRPTATITQQFQAAGRFLAGCPELVFAPPAALLAVVVLTKLAARTLVAG